MGWPNWLRQQLEVRHGAQQTLAPMEGLRGVAVFLVFLVHYCALIQPWLAPNTSGAYVSLFLGSAGHIGVDIFFMLSGYLIYGSLLSHNAFRFNTYLGRRIRRIYPAFLAMLTIYLVLSFVFPKESKLPSQLLNGVIYILENILLLPGILKIEPIITVAWSLSYELFFYMTLPLVMRISGIRRWQLRNRLVFWIALATLGEIFYSQLGGGHIRLEMFIAGIILLELQKHGGVKLKHGIGGASLIIAALTFGALDRLDMNYGAAILALFILSIALGLEAFTPDTPTARLLSISPVRWLGNMSYSYYLIHGLTLKFCFLMLAMLYPPLHTDSALMFWLWLPLFSLSLIAGLVLFVLIERPLSINYQRRPPAPDATQGV